MKTAVKFFRFEDAWLPNFLAWSYIGASYFFGFTAIMADHLGFNVVGVFLLAHSMVIAAYFIHECAHDSLFKKNRHNQWFAELMLWICGASYSDYKAIQHKHVRHHMDRADIVSFDFRTRLIQYPKVLKVITCLEWFYIPALEIMMHTLVLILPFIKTSRKHLRFRIITVLVVRVVFFATLALLSPRVLVLYPLAYMLFLTVMRFMDVHQHTYDLYETLDVTRGDEVKKYDSAFEKRNTYSNILSLRYPWLNLLVLNFSFHNVHHDQQIQPWYRLPKLHQTLYAENEVQVLSFFNLLQSYHRYRVARVINSDAVDSDVHRGKDFIGVDGVSFLTAH